jgi:hypothetical protein
MVNRVDHAMERQHRSFIAALLRRLRLIVGF